MRLGNRRLTHKDHKKTTKNEPNPISRNWGLCCNVIKVAAAQHPFALWFFVLECSRRLEPIRNSGQVPTYISPICEKKVNERGQQQQQGSRKRISTLKWGRWSSVEEKHSIEKNTHRFGYNWKKYWKTCLLLHRMHICFREWQWFQNSILKSTYVYNTINTRLVISALLLKLIWQKNNLPI